jgi:hypothetical protein
MMLPKPPPERKGMDEKEKRVKGEEIGKGEVRRN